MSNNPTYNEVKINIVYKDFDGDTAIESVWAERAGDYYKIDNIPFFAYNLSLGDIVSVDEEDGVLYFDELIEPSGHSTIQMIIYDKSNVGVICDKLISLGCNWEGSHLEGYISVDVPATLSYIPIKKYLEQGKEDDLWDYKEACLAHSYNDQ